MKKAIVELGYNASYVVFDNSYVRMIDEKCIQKLDGIDAFIQNAGVSFLRVTSCM